MSSVYDVARYILEKTGDITAMKLQKLVYYSQAWSLVWDEEVLFDSPIEAWANGPVVRELYNVHRGKFKVNADTFSNGNSSNLTRKQKDTIDGVLEFYGDKTAQWLSDLAHMEDPWKNSRKKAKLSEGERGHSIIELSDIHEYYSGI